MVADTKYYDLLGVATDATAEEIKNAYRRRAREYHPDKTQGDKHKEALFKAMKQAYEILINESTRREYDEKGASMSSTPLELEAHGILATMFQQMIDAMMKAETLSGIAAVMHGQGMVNTIDKMKSDIRHNTVQRQNSIEAIMRTKETLLGLKKKVDHDGKGENLFAKVLDEIVSNGMREKENLEHVIKVNKKIEEMLDHYSDHSDEIQQLVYTSYKNSPTGGF